MWVVLILAGWLVLARFVPRFTITDRKAIRQFRREGIALYTKTMTTGRHRLHFVWTGNVDRPTLLFIHGSPRSWTFYKNFLKDQQLLNQYRLVAVDRPGFGQSGFGNAEPIHKQALIIRPLIKWLNNDRPLILIGHSLGAPVAVCVAAMENVSGLVIIAGALNPDEERPGLWRKLLHAIPLRWFVPGALRTTNDEMLFLQKDLEQLEPAYSTIRCPVIVMHGTKDRVVSYANAGWAADKFNNAVNFKMVTIDGAGHYLPWKNFNMVKDVLLGL
jgi:pimeloyl-ACP methyl ester carboxylesterase